MYDGIFALNFKNSYLMMTALIFASGYFPFLIYYRIKFKHWKLFGFEFTKTRHWIMMSPFFWATFLWGYFHHALWFPIVFLIQGVWGMIGEVLFSAHWRLLMQEPLYYYTAGAFLNGYTSTINFIAWGTGYIVYSTIVNIFGPRFPLHFQIEALTSFWQVTAAVFVITILARYLYVKRDLKKMSSPVGTGVFVLCALPYVSAFLWIGYKYSINYIFIGLFFGFLGSWVEYIYGRVSELLLDRQLWVYVPKAVDHGHYTPLSTIGFLIGGQWLYTAHLFWFWFMSRH